MFIGKFSFSFSLGFPCALTSSNTKPKANIWPKYS